MADRFNSNFNLGREIKAITKDKKILTNMVNNTTSSKGINYIINIFFDIYNYNWQDIMEEYPRLYEYYRSRGTFSGFKRDENI